MLFHPNLGPPAHVLALARQPKVFGVKLFKYICTHIHILCVSPSTGKRLGSSSCTRPPWTLRTLTFASIGSIVVIQHTAWSWTIITTGGSQAPEGDEEGQMWRSGGRKAGKRREGGGEAERKGKSGREEGSGNEKDGGNGREAGKRRRKRNTLPPSPPRLGGSIHASTGSDGY